MTNGIVSILDSEEEFQIVGCLAHRLPCTRKKKKIEASSGGLILLLGSYLVI